MQSYVIDTTRNVYNMLQDYADQGVDLSEEMHKQILEMSYRNMEQVPTLQPFLPMIREMQGKMMADTFAVIRTMNAQWKSASGESFSMASGMLPQLEQTWKSFNRAS